MTEYKGFKAEVEYDSDRNNYFGSVTNANKDVITFQGDSLEEAEKEFHVSVDDYLDFSLKGKIVEQLKQFETQLNVAAAAKDVPRVLDLQKQILEAKKNVKDSNDLNAFNELHGRASSLLEKIQSKPVGEVRATDTVAHQNPNVNDPEKLKELQRAKLAEQTHQAHSDQFAENAQKSQQAKTESDRKIQEQAKGFSGKDLTSRMEKAYEDNNGEELRKIEQELHNRKAELLSNPQATQEQHDEVKQLFNKFNVTY
jgi:predicted HicB family RNase H-like nuclease